MTSGFSRGRNGNVVAVFEAAEVSLLRSLASMMLGIVSPGQTSDDPLERALGIGVGDGAAPSDPVLARLFPSAYQDDKESAEFRRYTEATLRDGKRADAQTVHESARSGRFELSPEQAQAWLRALNDLRLTLGTKLEVTEEIHDQIATMSEDDPRYPAYVTYDWLTYLQDSLVRALW
ncbi:DUF2017 domain-containing protein [Nonomuraea sp. MG754425]|uniref:DUF2017 domain-containing protein n=1 Tax=Nonomuraea sp. MG754425 TaxID=2570319 RepID=UPI001F36275A|nr:DUF2017 domain-containing protein [Nonomuraea sp. MG754425]MCF6467168.1 DUF2017 domain-containing protein [Nonomuraea sp. MG754425]